MSTTALPKLVVLVSGSGTNLQALIDATNDGTLSAEIVLVVSNRASAYGLVRADSAEIPTLTFPFAPYKQAGKSRSEYDADLASAVAQANPDLIVLAGWMRILTPAFLDAFPQRVINLHPALPGQFAGTHAIERAFEAYQRGELDHSGCMVHVAIPEVDAGEVIDIERVDILPDDTLDAFEARMHSAEHRLIVRATQKALDALAG